MKQYHPQTVCTAHVKQQLCQNNTSVNNIVKVSLNISTLTCAYYGWSPPSVKIKVLNHLFYVLQDTSWAKSSINAMAEEFCFELAEHHLQSQNGEVIQPDMFHREDREKTTFWVGGFLNWFRMKWEASTGQVEMTVKARLSETWWPRVGDIPSWACREPA